jgi:hypothetical protein
MRRRTVMPVVLGTLVLAGAGAALATPPSGLKSELLARGNAGTFRIHDKSMDLKLHAGQSTDVAVVKATLERGGTTGWHGHPGPSIVIVKSGAVEMREPARRHHGDDDDDEHGRDRGPACSVQRFGPGSAFVHPEHEHTFVNVADGVTELYVVYMVPAGAAPLLNDVATVPSECS